MNGVLRGGLDRFCLVYLDDILVYSPTAESHESHLRWVFERLRDNKMYVKWSKCSFGQDGIEYLGHRVSRDGIQPDPTKINVVATWPAPTC